MVIDLAYLRQDRLESGWVTVSHLQNKRAKIFMTYSQRLTFITILLVSDTTSTGISEHINRVITCFVTFNHHDLMLYWHLV